MPLDQNKHSWIFTKKNATSLPLCFVINIVIKLLNNIIQDKNSFWKTFFSCSLRANGFCSFLFNLCNDLHKSSWNLSKKSCPGVLLYIAARQTSDDVIIVLSSIFRHKRIIFNAQNIIFFPPKQLISSYGWLQLVSKIALLNLKNNILLHYFQISKEKSS